MRDIAFVQQHVAKLLVVFFSDNLNYEKHVNFVLTVCSQRIYMLKLLRSQGLPPKQLQTVLNALTSQSLWSRYDRHFVGITRYNFVELNCEGFSCYSNKTESLSVRQCPCDH